MSQPSLELKGSNFTLSVIHLYKENIDEIKQGLADKMAQAPAFLKFAPIVINISHLQNFSDWVTLKNIIEDVGFFLVGMTGYKDNNQKLALNQAGIATLTEGKHPDTLKSQKTEIQSVGPETTNAAESTESAPMNNSSSHNANVQSQTEINQPKTKVITTPVRSGQQIYARNADLVILNNVGAGAEIIADGNIHVYGIMRGKALAGASGDESAQIFCQQLEAEVISIAGNYWLSDKIPQDFIAKSAHISFNEGEITIKSL